MLSIVNFRGSSELILNTFLFSPIISMLIVPIHFMNMLCFCTLCSYDTCDRHELYVNKDMFCSAFHFYLVLLFNYSAGTYWNNLFVTVAKELFHCIPTTYGFIE